MEAAGFNSLLDKLKRLESLAQQKLLIGAARKAMQPVLEDAMALAPKDTGLLALSALKLSTDKKLRGGAVGAAGLKFAGPHKSIWHFAEFGTSRQAAHPFLRPAMRKNVSKVIDIFREEMRIAIDRALKKQEAQSFSGRARKAAGGLRKKAKRIGKRAKRSFRKLSKRVRR